MVLLNNIGKAIYDYMPDIFTWGVLIYSYWHQLRPKKRILIYSNLNNNKSPFLDLDISFFLRYLCTKIHDKKEEFVSLLGIFSSFRRNKINVTQQRRWLIVQIKQESLSQTVFIYHNSFTMLVSVVKFWVLMNLIYLFLLYYLIRDSVTTYYKKS